MTPSSQDYDPADEQHTCTGWTPHEDSLGSTPRKAGESVWATGQQQARQQRGSRYSRLSVEHPARMLPVIAQHAIATYTRPGDLVMDPMCGIGTSLVEAAHLGRDAFGVELEPKWASIARLNLQTAHVQGAPGSAQVHTGEAARTLSRLGEQNLAGKVRLVLTSPPYGAMTHGQVRSRRDGADAVEKHAHTYARERQRTRSNLAYQRPGELMASFTRILAACRPLLAPGGVVVVTTRPYRTQGRLVDFPGQMAEAGRRAGLVQVDRCAALLCALRDGGVVSRTSFFQLIETRRLRSSGWPVHVIQHEDALVFANPTADHSVQEAGAAA